MNDKLKTITNLFEGKEIRSIWDSNKEDYYFSVVDVIGALTESNIPKRYWTDLKKKLILEGSQLYENIVQLKMKALDGKMRQTDVLDTEGIFRLIESVPSPNAEPFKLWLAKLGRQEVDNVFDPSRGIDKMIDYYLRKESLRDNMTDIEVALTDLSEIAAREFAKTHQPRGLEENKKVAKLGGHAAKVAREDIEKNLGASVISKENKLKYKYIDNDKQISN